jgi:uncharacterized protein with von Willebrand factor type A (vWA) domain
MTSITRCESSALTKALIDSVLHSGLPNKPNIYYFHDCPEELLYEQPELVGACPFIDVLTEHIKNSAVLIISDAGAARGHYDGRRVADTKRFIKTLSAYTYLYSWVNPLPSSRWRTTTAEDIACIVPMYPLTREGLIDAFTILQGHPFPSKVGIYE